MSNKTSDKLVGLDRRVNLMLEGVRTKLSKHTVLRVGKERLSVAEIEKVLAAMEKLRAAVRELHDALHAAKIARDADKAKTLAFLADLKVAIVAHYGRESSELEGFGVKPYVTPRKLTGQELVARTTKANATRKTHSA